MCWISLAGNNLRHRGPGHNPNRIYAWVACPMAKVPRQVASLLVMWQLWRDGHRDVAVLRSTPIILMAVVTAVALGGTLPPLSLLLWLDLFVLLVFVVVLGRFGRQILRTSPPDPSDPRP